MDIQAFIDTLPIMLYGMSGIFVVILIIMMVTVLLIKVFPDKK
ncbi:MAG: OadG-related small transporter subunit [Clostridiales bacterium]